VSYFDTPIPGQRFFAPEVVQTSAMDCGPAALKSILEGFEIPVSYGRLREACQTDVDGTSINTIEDIAIQLGLEAEQIMLPADHLALDEAQALPAIVVVQRPSGLTHFLVVWSRFGDFLQVMDPATGRRWPTINKLFEELYIHSFPVSAQAWREWAGSDGLLAPLRRRLSDIEIDEKQIEDLIEDASSDQGWRSLATLDATTRMISSIVRGGGISTGNEAGKVIDRFYKISLESELPTIEKKASLSINDSIISKKLQIPDNYWSVLPIQKQIEQEIVDTGDEELMLRGAVLIRILGKREKFEELLEEEGFPERLQEKPLSIDLEAALTEAAYKPEREVWNALKEDGLLTPYILTLAILASTFTVLIEALLFQGIIQIGQSFTLLSQKILAMLAVLAFIMAPFFLEFPIGATVLRMGRRLETRLRIAFLEKIPRLGDRYFRSRLASDMTQRAHELRELRMLPDLGVSLLRTAFQLILTTIGVIWLDPLSAPLAIVGTVFFVTLSYFTRPFLEEQDLRMRTQIGGLSRFYLDALLGLIPIRTHGAERAMRRQHETQLYEWVRTGRNYNNSASILQSFGVLLYSAFVILIVINYLSKGGDVGEILLLFYWTLSLPSLGQALADLIQQYPTQRNRMLRLLEPLGAPDEEEAWKYNLAQENEVNSFKEIKDEPVDIDILGVDLNAGGHTILQEVNLKIEAGEHVAIVGESGAGKSSLVGLLLGWQRPSKGKILIDGKLLDGKGIQKLRNESAWVDPAIQIWNRSFFENIRYGSEYRQDRNFSEVINTADLFNVIERLPEGLRTKLGEGGGLVSGGEGQRVRLGRALYRNSVRLIILDEPFRGLDREKRKKLLLKSREYWRNQTLLCITHDVGETINFSRVLVIQDGKIVEDGAPNELASDPSSYYRKLLETEDEVRKGMWESTGWKRMWLDQGKIKVLSGDEEEKEKIDK